MGTREWLVINGIGNMKRRDRVTCRGSIVVYLGRREGREGVEWVKKGPVRGKGEEQAMYTGLMSLR